MELNNRLHILMDANQISQRTFDEALKVIDMFNSRWNISLTEENGSMFITHLSIALERILKGETIEHIEESVYQEVLNNKNFHKYEKIVNDIEAEIDIKIPENEKVYLNIYVCNIFENA